MKLHPPITPHFPPPIFRSFAVFSSDIDLTAQSGCPAYPAARLEVHNDATTTQDVILRGPDASNQQFEVPADSIRTIEGQIAAIESTGTETISTAVAYWWDDGARKNP